MMVHLRELVVSCLERLGHPKQSAHGKKVAQGPAGVQSLSKMEKVQERAKTSPSALPQQI